MKWSRRFPRVIVALVLTMPSAVIGRSSASAALPPPGGSLSPAALAATTDQKTVHIASYAKAARLAPGSRPYRLLLADARRQALQPTRGAAVPASARGFPPPAYAQAAPLLPPPTPNLPVQAGGPPDPNPLLKIGKQ